MRRSQHYGSLRDLSPWISAVRSFEGAGHQETCSILVLDDAVSRSQTMPELQSVRFVQ